MLRRILQVCCLMLTSVAATAQSFDAAAVLPPPWVESPHHQLLDEVRFDAGYLRFVVSSDFGLHAAGSLSELRERVYEVRAMSQALSQFEISEEDFRRAITGRQGVGSERVLDLIADPFNTAGKLAGNLGSNLNRTLEGDYGAPSPLEQVISAEAAAVPLEPGPQQRSAAFQFSLDPYSRNSTVQVFIEQVAKARTEGNLGGAIAILDSNPLKLPVLLNGIPDRRVASRVKNETRAGLEIDNLMRLQSAGIATNRARALQANSAFLPAQQARIAEYLSRLADVAGLDELVGWLAGSDSINDAYASTDVVRMLTYFHSSNARLERILPVDFLPVAMTSEGCAVVVPFDYITPGAEADNITSFARDACGGSIHLLLLGFAEPTVASAWRSAGVTVDEAYSFIR